jgi:hypothetical protein
MYLIIRVSTSSYVTYLFKNVTYLQILIIYKYFHLLLSLYRFIYSEGDKPKCFLNKVER